MPLVMTSAMFSFDAMCSTVMSPLATNSRERRYLFSIQVREVLSNSELDWWKTALLSSKHQHGSRSFLSDRQRVNAP